MVVRAGPYRSNTADAAMANRSSSSWSSAAGEPGRSNQTVPISSSSSVTGVAEGVGQAAPVASWPSAATRMVRPVPWMRIPATHPASPADARTSAGRSTRRRIRVS